MARFSLGRRRTSRRDEAEHAAKPTPVAEYAPLTSEMPIQTAGPRRSAMPLSVALLNKQSIGGAAAILLCALFFILVLPAISDHVKGEDLTVGVPLAVGENLQVTPPPGWVLSNTAEGGMTSLTNSGAQLVITSAAPATESVATRIQTLADALADDPNNSWVVTPPSTFTTTAGDSGATVTAQSKDAATQVWVVSDGNLQTTLVLTSPLSVWDGISDSANAIAASVKFTPEDLP
ncbi:hypothetical protein [Demequina aurantiaca]|uniref:hypothetical protein n=1 Tax=Demequina aurantiaca TaxID=676200 RepID=UPI00078167BB|nr:hypothetical protein [Demequina aurantiaca]